MTYNNLYKEIIALGFESEIESDELVISSVNRALRTIFTERPSFAELSIYQRKYTPTLKIDLIEHKSFETDTLNYNARCYSFISNGTGSYKITENGTEKSFNFSGENEIHRGFLHGEGKMEFYGDFSFVVTNLCFFSELFGASETTIPVLCGYFEYDVDEHTDDFISFYSVPTDANGKVIEKASVSGSVAKIPAAYSGEVNLVYKKGARAIRGVGDEEIKTPDGCEHLLPLLAAAYIWLDDDPEKAEYYMSLYREGMSAVKYYNRTNIGGEYRSTNGWA